MTGGSAYASSRPTYPEALADFLADTCEKTEHALDVGCGSGQLSVLLANRFDLVTATDPSEEQLKSAKAHPRVTYKREAAEQISLPDDSVDLVTAAQAAHWFDLETFYDEVRRVARTGAVLSLISYGVPEMDGTVGELLKAFYWQDIYSHWPAGRRHVEEGYQSLEFPFAEQKLPPLTITRTWSKAELLAYMSTWSAVKRAETAGNGKVFDRFCSELDLVWPELDHLEMINWPIVGRLACVDT